MRGLVFHKVQTRILEGQTPEPVLPVQENEAESGL